MLLKKSQLHQSLSSKKSPLCKVQSSDRHTMTNCRGARGHGGPPYSDHPPLHVQGTLKLKVLVAQSCPTLRDPMDCGLCSQTSPGRNTGVGCHSPGDFPNPGIKLGSPALQADSLPSELPGLSFNPTPVQTHRHTQTDTHRQTHTRALTCTCSGTHSHMNTHVYTHSLI